MLTVLPFSILILPFPIFYLRFKHWFFKRLLPISPLKLVYINRQSARGYHYSNTNACGESAASNKHVYFMFQDTCSGKGGYLAEINSEDENDYLKQHILGNYLKTIHILKSQVAFNKNEIRA